MILYDKPAGVTSAGVVAQVLRRLLKESRATSARQRAVKVGHGGTLDPFATGLLLILVGRATRVQRFLMELPKRYEVVARFGARSTTHDPEGEILETGVVPAGDLVLPTGRICQRPPAYSAVKVGGRRAYALARAGETVELAERQVEVYRFDELWRDGPRRAFAIECSAGTYVRSLIADLGDAYCQELRRTAIGGFEVTDADGQRLVGLQDALGFLPELQLDSKRADQVAHGRAVPGQAAGVVRLTDERGLIAVGEPAGGEGMVRPVVVLRPAG